jgi:hypothetical protein
MTDPFEEGREKLLRLRIALKPEPSPASVTPPTPPSPPILPSAKGFTVKAFLGNFVGVAVKRLVTFGVGYAVAKGLLPLALAEAVGEKVEAAIAVVVLTAVYAAYDKFLKPYLVKFLGTDDFPVAK